MMNPQQLRAHIQRVKQERAIRVVSPSSGLEYRIVRSSLDAYLNGGRLPEHFVLVMKRVNRKEIGPEEAYKQTTPEEEIAYSKFLYQLLQDSVVSPSVVFREATSDDEIDAAELVAIGDFNWLISEILGQVPDQPVQTKKGETSVAALERFPDGAERGVCADTGNDSPQVQPASVATAGD